MKLALIILGACVVIAVGVLLAAASIYNSRSDSKPEAKEFLAGKAPEPALDGSYKGNRVTGLDDNWLGKHFNSRESTGINNFASKSNAGATEQRYPFATSQVAGLRNKSQTVLQLNYNIGSNPLWLKLIRDELVEVSPGNYLGKIQLKVGFVVVTLGYFRLSN